MSHEIPTMNASPRERTGTRYSYRLRRDGKLPAVIYGHKQEPLHVTVDTAELVGHLHKGAHVLKLNLDKGKVETCLIKDVQYDYLGDEVIHADLARIDLTEQVELSVPIEVKNKDMCPALKTTGAILHMSRQDLEIRCLP